MKNKKIIILIAMSFNLFGTVTESDFKFRGRFVSFNSNPFESNGDLEELVKSGKYKLSATIPNPDPEFKWLLFLSKLKILVALRKDSGSILTFDYENNLQKILLGHEGGINEVIDIEDGNIASASDDCTVRIWDPKSGNCKTLDNGSPVNTITRFGEESEPKIAAGLSNGEIKIWNPKFGTLLRSMRLEKILTIIDTDKLIEPKYHVYRSAGYSETPIYKIVEVKTDEESKLAVLPCPLIKEDGYIESTFGILNPEDGSTVNSACWNNRAEDGMLRRNPTMVINIWALKNKIGYTAVSDCHSSANTWDLKTDISEESTKDERTYGKPKYVPIFLTRTPEQGDNTYSLDEKTMMKVNKDEVSIYVMKS